MFKFKPEGNLLPMQQNSRTLSSPALLKEAFYSGTILEARAVLCDAQHNLHVDLGCMNGIIPKNEGALGISEGCVRDIALISRVNKAVIFKITGFEEDPNTHETYAVLSRKKVQEDCIKDYIKKLNIGDVIDATVTHLESFGAFCDVGAGISALLPIDSISVSRIPHPSARLSVGENIKVIVKSIDSLGRLTLSHKELLGTWEENAKQFSVGETVPGIVRSVEKYGIFVELTPNLAGLAEYCDGVSEGDQASVYIKSIIPSRMKVKLIIVDSFKASYPPSKEKYYIDSPHIDYWYYSPLGCDKEVKTEFK